MSYHQVCTTLCKILREGVDVHRCLAAQALGHIGDAQAVEPLAQSLLDEDEDVRADAAGALARLADGRAGGRLLDNLIGDPCIEVKLGAIEALARMRHVEAIPILRQVLMGPNEAIAWDEAAFYETGWDGWADIQLKAVEALAALGADEAVPDIIACLDDEHGQDLTETAFRALAELGDHGIAALAATLDSADARRRRRAAAVLAGLETPAADEATGRALGDHSAAVRYAATRALAARAPDDPRLSPLLADEDPEVRALAARLYAHVHPDRLADLLDDRAPEVRRATLEGLAGRPELTLDNGVVDRVHALLHDAPEVAAAAAEVLSAHAPADATESLCAVLADGKGETVARAAAARALGRIGGEGALAALTGVVGDGQRQVRLEALTALVILAGASEEWPSGPGEALLAALRGELVDPSGPVEEQTAEAPQVKVGAPPRVDGIAQTDAVDGTDSSKPAVVTSTLQAIVGGSADAPMDDPAEAPAIEFSKEDLEYLALARRVSGKRRVTVVPNMAPPQDVRRFAARLLGDLPRDEVALELTAALESDDREVRLAAAQSLAQIGKRIDRLPQETVKALIGVVERADRDLRLAAVCALGTTVDEHAIASLTTCLRDRDELVRAEAVHGLSALGEVDDRITALLDDPERSVQLAAANAIAEANGTNAVGRLVDFAFTANGYHRRTAGRLLRRLNRAAANARLVEILGDRNRINLWPAAIEALEELNRTDPAGDQSRLA